MALKKKAPDFIMFITVMMLLCIGIIMVFSSSSYYAMLPPFNNPFWFLIKQLVNTLVGIPAMLFMMRYDYWKLKKWSFWALLVAAGFLILVLTPLGTAKLGAQRWIFGFQPSELAKLCIVLFVAASLSQKGIRLQRFREGILPYLILMAFFAGLILAEPDLGTAMTLVGTIFVMLFCAGVRTGSLAGVGILGVAGVMAAIFAEGYRRKRFFAFLDPEGDPTGTGWHILNSLMSLGSGGLLGTGLGQGRHSKFLYLPERQTDFIFAVIGEELGFIGGCLVILLFVLFVWRGFKVAITAPDPFASLLAAGIVSGIALQAIINIGVVTSSLPITGITLPFVSFGGTSLVFTLIGVRILLNISKYSSLK